MKTIKRFYFAPPPYFNPLVFSKAVRELQDIVFTPRTLPSSPPPFKDLFDQHQYAVSAICKELKSTSLNRFPPKSLARIVFQLSKANHNDPVVFEKISDHLLGDIELPNHFFPHEVALIASGYSQLGIQDYILFSKLSKDLQLQMKKRSREFHTDDLIRVATAFSKLGFGDPDLFTALHSMLQTREWNALTGQDISSILRAFVTSGFKFPDLFFRMGQLVCAPQMDLSQFYTLDLCLILNSFARFGREDVKVFDRLLHEVNSRNLSEFDNKNIKVILWTLETLNLVKSPMFHKFLTEYNVRVPHDPYEF